MAGTSICVLQLNAEGLTSSKRDLILHITRENGVNIICLQETHCETEEQLQIDGFDLICFIPHRKHGIASYVKQGIQASTTSRSSENSAIQWITFEAMGNHFCNLYKPPPADVEIPLLPTMPSNSFVCGDFNSRNTAWGYPNTNTNGQVVFEWAESQELEVLHSSKDHPTFFSGSHKSWTCPDVSLVSSNIRQTCSRLVLSKFPRSGHCPIIITSNIKLQLTNLPKKRWNFRKADWPKFKELTANQTANLPDPTSSNVNASYSAFCTMLHQAAKLSIPRGRRHPYIPCWDEDCDQLYNTHTDESKSTEERETAGCDLLKALGEKRKTRWEEEVSNINFTHSSRKAWNTINKLTGRSNTPKQCPVTANSIASVLVNNGKWQDKSTEAKTHSRSVNREIKKQLQSNPQSSFLSEAFSMEEMDTALKSLKNGKAPGNDNIHTEFLKNLSPEATSWLQSFLSTCLTTSTIPSKWKTAKVTAILKPNKPASDPKSYRPISLLSHIYKLLERLILARINDIVEEKLPTTQAGFRKGKSTTDQVVRLVHDIEAAFQKNHKFGTVFVDLTAAYDTVWHRGLYLKVLQTIPDVKLVKFIMLLVQDRSFILETSTGECSRKRRLRNGVPQGSVLAPILFNIYVSDMPKGDCKQYSYADDSALGYDDHSFEVIEASLEKDANMLATYFNRWHLKLSLPKTVTSVFHLANRCAKRELNVYLNGSRLKFDPSPKYLGITLDRSLTFHEHAKATADKTQGRVSLLRKLAGTGWGADFTTLRTSALALAFSTAEYASPVWSHSSHVYKVNTVLNDAMRLVSGTLTATPISNLPILSGIPPANLRRNAQTAKLAHKRNGDDSLIPAPVALEDQRLARRHFATQTAELLLDRPPSSLSTWTAELWAEQWMSSNTRLQDFIPVPSTTPSGCHLTRKAWVNLNRIRTGVARTQYFLQKIGADPSPNCACGEIQTLDHIIEDCPIFKSPHGAPGIVELDNETISWLNQDLPL